MSEFLSAKTERKVLVEYPIDIAYACLLDTFPVRNYRMVDRDNNLHSVEVHDFSNSYFIMRIYLCEYGENSTVADFIADYPHAVSDIGGGCDMAIYAVLEAYMNELKKRPKATGDDFSSLSPEIEIADPETFVNPLKTKKNTKTIALGYILSLLSLFSIIAAYVFYEYDGLIFVSSLFAGIICFCLGITASTLLQISENSKSVLHGRVQTCICGLSLIILGLFIHISISIAGVIIILIVFLYFRNRDKF